MNALTNEEDIRKFRIYSLLKGFKLEIETGVKLTSRISTMKFIKENFMINGNRKKDVYNNFLAYCWSIGVVDREQYYKEKLPVRN